MIRIVTQTILIIGRAIRLDGNMLITRNGDQRDSYNLKWFRPLVDPAAEVRRMAPDKRETCQNLTKLAQMAKSEKARMAYEKQYVGTARRYLAGKEVNSLG